MLFSTKQRRGYAASPFLRHTLACFMVGLLMALCACGSQTEPPVSTHDSPTTSQTRPTVTTEPEKRTDPGAPTETEIGSNSNDTADHDPDPSPSNATDAGSSDGDVEIPAEPKPAPEETQNVPTTPASKEIKGLILMKANTGYSMNDFDRILITDELAIYSFDPDTGAANQLTTFTIRPFTNGRTFNWFPNTENVCHWFDPSYTKLSANCLIDDTGDQHAGWIDNNGNFFDVTEAVGMARQGDFGGRVDQEAFGITDDGMFVFDDWGGVYPRKTSKRTTYYVPINDVRPETVKEGQPFAVTGLMRKVVEPFGDDKYLTGDGHGTCVIVDAPENRNGAKFIPDSDRKNWSPLASPDGTHIAFMSQPSKGAEPADIFITTPDGGDPVRVPSHEFTLGRMGGFSNILQGGDTILLDWR